MPSPVSSSDFGLTPACLPPMQAAADGDNAEAAAAAAAAAAEEEEEEDADMADWSKEDTEVPFLVLTLDIPPTPLFQDAQGGNIIPQVRGVEGGRVGRGVLATTNHGRCHGP